MKQHTDSYCGGLVEIVEHESFGVVTDIVVKIFCFNFKIKSCTIAQ